MDVSAMNTKRITNMKIKTLLQKPAWRRKLPPRVVPKHKTGVRPMIQTLSTNIGTWMVLTQEDFYNELEPSAHLINSEQYKSFRPKFKFDKTTKKYKIVGYEDVERVSIGLEAIALRSATTHTLCGDFKFSNEGDDANGERVKKIQSYWFRSAMREAILDMGYNFYGIGDSAIYLYVDKKRIYYKVFSYLYGDIISKPNSKTFVRKTSLFGKDVIEVYTDESVDVWIHKDTLNYEILPNILMELGEGQASVLETSEDDYVKIKSTPHSWGVCPVIYHREDDVVWGKGVSGRERIEKIMSYWGDNNNVFAFPMFYFDSKAVQLPDMGAAGKAIGVPKDGKAGIIEPPDISSSFLEDLNKNMKMYCDTLGIVMIDPKDLKGGGETSGTYVQNLYFPAVQQAELRLAKLRKMFNEILDLFANMVGSIEGETLDYKTIEISYFAQPFIPHSVMEDITIVNQCVNAGTTSQETASELIDHNSPYEMQRLKKEAQAKEDAKIKTNEANKDNGGNGAIKDNVDNNTMAKKKE